MGRAARRAPQIACITVQEARRASTLPHRRLYDYIVETRCEAHSSQCDIGGFP